MIRMERIWGIHAWLVEECLKDFEGKDWRARPAGANPAVWQVGHLLSCRRYLAGVLGMEEGAAIDDEAFGAGSDPDRLPAEMDGPALLREFGALHGRFAEHLAALDFAVLDEEIEDEFPNLPPTRLAALQFMLMHEAYHLGQLGQLRVQLGKPSWMEGMQAPPGGGS